MDVNEGRTSGVSLQHSSIILYLEATFQNWLLFKIRFLRSIEIQYILIINVFKIIQERPFVRN